MKSRRTADDGDGDGDGDGDEESGRDESDTALAWNREAGKLTRPARLPARGATPGVPMHMDHVVHARAPGRAASRVVSASVALATFAIASSTACRAVTLAYSAEPSVARAHADALLSAFEARFTRVTLSPRFAHARDRIARYALAPSKLARDTSLWTGMRSTPLGAERDLELSAGLTGTGPGSGQFAFVDRLRVPLPTRTGDQRHLIQLQQLQGSGDWLWKTEVDHAVGSLSPARSVDIVRALFASAERPPAAVRIDYQTAFPRTTLALGRLFTIDSLQTTAQADGSTLVALHILVHGKSLRPGYPALAGYVAKYVEPATYGFRLSDRAGADWFDAQSVHSRMVVRFRTHDGELQPLRGGARRMPDSLRVRVDVTAKFGLFTVGASNLLGDFVHVRTPVERGWAMRFTTEPEWDLPLFAERMLRTPLQRPFEGTGMIFSLALRTGPAGQTLLSRRFDVAVRESAIMRFLGNLGFGAMSDYQGRVELEEQRFIAEVMAAMRADIAATAG